MLTGKAAMRVGGAAARFDVMQFAYARAFEATAHQNGVRRFFCCIPVKKSWTALSLCGDFTQTIELLTLSPVRWIEG